MKQSWENSKCFSPEMINVIKKTLSQVGNMHKVTTNFALNLLHQSTSVRENMQDVMHTYLDCIHEMKII